MADGASKYKIEKNTVQETLVVPLYGRKLCTELYPALFEDKGAAELCERLDYDFSSLEQKAKSALYRFGILEIAARYYDILCEIKDYLKARPDAAIVNLGCGLDSTGSALAGGRRKAYNIDLPDVIAIRNELLPPREGEKNIAADLNDTAWFNEIDDSAGAVFFAAGVFYYFTKESALALFRAMSERFAGGRLVFDAANEAAVKVMIKTWVKQAGIQDVGAYFAASDAARELISHIPNAAISSRGYMLGYSNLKEAGASRFFRLLSRACDRFMKMQIVRMDFR